MMKMEDIVLLSKSKLKGHNPCKIKGYVLRPTDDTEIYVVPKRALEVLDVLIDEKPAMFRNPKGHMPPELFDPYCLGPVKSIEAFFTAGLNNVGPPQNHAPLHGTFSQKKAKILQYIEEKNKTGLKGIIRATDLVSGPDITVERCVYAKKGERAFFIEDKLRANLSSYYMWLYHPVLNLENKMKLLINARDVVARDLISNCDIERYDIIENVREGVYVFPPTQPKNKKDYSTVRQENFERCYVIKPKRDNNGDVYAALVNAEEDKGAYIKYNLDDFTPQQAFHFWKNPRDGCAGLEVGSTFMGWEYAKKHNLLCFLKKGSEHTYRIKVGFLMGKEEVRDFVTKHELGSTKPKIHRANGKGQGNSHSRLDEFYKN